VLEHATNHTQTRYLQAKKTSTMNLKYLLPFLIIALHSCDKTVENKSFEISGLLNDDFDGYVYLYYGNTIDSVLVNKRKFQFNGKVDNVEEGYLSLKSGAKQEGLYLENCTIDLKTEFDYREYNDEGQFPFISITSIEGTNTEKIRKDYYDFNQKNQNKEDFPNLLYKKLDTLITENSDHPFSGGILAGNARLRPILSKKEFIHLYSKLDTAKQNKSDLSLFKRSIASLEKYPEGKSFFEFTLPNKENEMLHFDNKYDKITLIDFWASSCAPCRKTNPKYVALKNRLKNFNFDILGISIDPNREDWLKAIDKDKLEWTNLIDIKKEVYDKLDVVGIPYSYLVDENGIILKVNPNIQEIEKIVREKASR